MAEGNPLADADADLLRPAWHDTPDETEADRRVAWPQAGRRPSATAVEPGRLAVRRRTGRPAQPAQRTRRNRGALGIRFPSASETLGNVGIPGTSRFYRPCCSAFPKRPSSATTTSRSQLCAVSWRRVSCQTM